MKLRLLLILAISRLGACEQSLYDFESSPLTQLTDENFDAEMVADTTALWVVEFYADWCGHCKQFAKPYEKVATNLKGLVKFGAVNADTAKATVSAAGVQ